MEELLLKFGYLLLFVGVAVEGEFVLIAGAYLAHQGYFNIWLVALTALLANWSSVQLYYALAKSRGRPWLERRFGHHAQFGQILSPTGRRADWLMLGSRFAIGFRIIIPAACGAVGIPTLRFTILNLVGGILWVVPVAWVGYRFGHGAQVVLGKAQRYELWFVLALALAALAVVLVRYKRRTAWIADLSLSELHRLAPYALAFMGIVNLASAMWPRSHAALESARSWLPLDVIEESRSLMLFTGIALLQISGGLIRRQKVAWVAATISITVTLVLHAMRALDLQHSLIAALLLAYLLFFRKRFSEPSERAAIRQVWVALPALMLATILYGYLGLSHLKAQFEWTGDANPLEETLDSAILIRQPAIRPQTELASAFLGSLQVAGWMARLYLLALLLKPAISSGLRARRR